ncbi:DUF2911 domain-containing protein [Fulvivirga sedimenti]|uniref:DUF2911 domain-containing protein n=1 Tax=Fulvivirga sedimenti TaxID=2879465 RepID=A0A9X1HP56_9BACT|nr:DUF2911 domain-containing protein [Fulvivirga sedimenti]MCA6074582.1 DUF2911 domain-containing protein [Fulvivirga sedimenti]MCA6075759.1 DUF2911 domain-containing protein [Fulvivirga sedimenti]MCA6076887.1 DUF2911 domain-containing protein [Fulvivirga sedimenti]
MKRILLINCLSIALLIAFSSANAQIQMPQPSPAGSVSTTVGLTDITIDYFRPGVKGRKIFGEGGDYLQPYGQIWRTGANNGSVLTLSTDAMIGGQSVPAGKYLIFTVPGADEWRFMLYKDLSIGGNTAAYNKDNEVLNIGVKSNKTSNTVESLTFQIHDISADNTEAKIAMAWENVALRIPVKVSFDDIVMADIKAKTQVDPNVYIQAANYYYTTGRDLEQALAWMDMGLQANPNAFWNIHMKAQILAKMGKKKEAIETANESMAKAKASGNDFGYVKRNQDLINSLK